MHPKFQIYTDISSLPISEHEAYQEEGFCGICTGGTAVIEVFSCLLYTSDAADE